MSKADESGTYTQARDLIRQIKQNDSQWENEILKARTSINYNYDPLVWPVVEMKRLWRAFESIETRNQHGNSPAWRQAYADYQQAFEEKANYVERFKSHNAVLRNSWRFCPPPPTVSRHNWGSWPMPTHCACTTFLPTPTT